MERRFAILKPQRILHFSYHLSFDIVKYQNTVSHGPNIEPDQNKMTDCFVYTPFDHESDQIRLLTIQPSNKNDPIRCTMQHVSLSQVTSRYNCLSYVWGDELDQRTILVDGKELGVRNNLYTFLLQAQRSMKIRRMPI